jgi:dCTP deaminase
LTVLSDRSIRDEIQKGRIVIHPLADVAIQPASVDLRLGAKLRVFQRHLLQAIDVKQEMPHLTELVTIDELNPFILHPGEFALGVTLETVQLPDDIVGRLDGKSSLGRLGLVVHSTAGFVDPGWKGHLTLELSNLANLPITLYAGMKVSQISFMQLTTSAENPYGSTALGSKYQDQDEPTASKYYLNYRRPDRRR